MAKHEGFVDVLEGIVYGDEGKGDIVDEKLAHGEYDVSARKNGANNAGHNVVTEGGDKLILNAVPSGVKYRDIICYIGSGCVVDPVHLIEKEIPDIEKAGLSLDGRFKISAAATAITPIHRILDGENGKDIGTTGKGVGPAYVSRALRANGKILENLRFAEILANHNLAHKTLREQYDRLLKHQLIPPVADIDAKIARFMVAVQMLNHRGYLEKDSNWLTKEVKSGKNVLMEGAQAYGLDAVLGAAPFVTSSSCVEGGAFVGGDVPVRYHRKTIGVASLIPTRVGNGPFVGEFGGETSELYCAEKDEKGNTKHNKVFEAREYVMGQLLKSDDPFMFGIGLRMATENYGATTGRPRRVGRIDLKLLSAAALRSGLDELVLTKMDCLRYFESMGYVPVITGYELDGARLGHMPITADELYRVKTVEEKFALPEEIRGVQRFEDLPPNAKALVDRIQRETGTRVSTIGIGPGKQHKVRLAA